MTAERDWARLVDSLNEWATAQVTERGIEVTFEREAGTSRTVELVVTPDGWREYWPCIYGDEVSAAAGLRDLLHDVPLDMGFLVYDNEQWEASHTRDFPHEEFHPEPGGQWVVTDDAGNVTSRFADWIDHHQPRPPSRPPGSCEQG